MANLNIDSETAYYQYMINNNSTSTMLRAISGDDSYTNSIGMLGLGDTGSFSSILQGLTQNTSSAEISSTEDAEMAEKLSALLEEASQTEDTSSVTYKTVQELYEYFSGKVSKQAAALTGSANSAAASGTSSASQTQTASDDSEFDFSSVDEEINNAFAEEIEMPSF